MSQTNSTIRIRDVAPRRAGAAPDRAAAVHAEPGLPQRRLLPAGLRRARVNLEKIKSVRALRELPFTTKEDLRKSYPYDMFAVPLRDIVRIHSTSGTTGKPIVVGYTRNDLRNWTECTARLLDGRGRHRARRGADRLRLQPVHRRLRLPPGRRADRRLRHPGLPDGQHRKADHDHAGLQDHGPGLARPATP